MKRTRFFSFFLDFDDKSFCIIWHLNGWIWIARTEQKWQNWKKHYLSTLVVGAYCKYLCKTLWIYFNLTLMHLEFMTINCRMSYCSLQVGLERWLWTIYYYTRANVCHSNKVNIGKLTHIWKLRYIFIRSIRENAENHRFKTIILC